MNENFAIQLFEGKKVRIAWDAEQEKYYFSVTDIVQVLTDSVNPRDYIKKMLRRDPELKSKWGTICPPRTLGRVPVSLLLLIRHYEADGTAYTLARLFDLQLC